MAYAFHKLVVTMKDGRTFFGTADVALPINNNLITFRESYGSAREIRVHIDEVASITSELTRKLGNPKPVCIFYETNITGFKLKVLKFLYKLFR
ncbi:hypothetical protein [Providencia rettgeri]|uniref:hypothetical protein n=1 Tax=Providencia rettgeri TaxID=587 RepID=UPI001F034009|nr:hypothetical protein [Providencia rettgeri]MCG9943679.1 hypothetical protein [Providencia rettgeri]